MALSYITREGGTPHFEYVVPSAEVTALRGKVSGVCYDNLRDVRARLVAATMPTLSALIQRDIDYIKRVRGAVALEEALAKWPVCINVERPVEAAKKTVLKSRKFARQVATMIHERLHALAGRLEIDTELFRATVKTDRYGSELYQPVTRDDIIKAELEKYYPKAVVARMVKYSLARGWSNESVAQQRIGQVRLKGRGHAAEELVARIASIQYFQELLNELNADASKKLALRDHVYSISSALIADISNGESEDARLLRILLGEAPPVVTKEDQEAFQFFRHAAVARDFASWKRVPPATKLVRDAFAPYVSARAKFLLEQPSFPRGTLVRSFMPAEVVENYLASTGSARARKYGMFTGTATVVSAKLKEFEITGSGPGWIYVIQFPDGEQVELSGGKIERA